MDLKPGEFFHGPNEFNFILVVVPITATVNTAVNEFFTEGSVGNSHVPVLWVVITRDDPTVGSNHLAH